MKSNIATPVTLVYSAEHVVSVQKKPVKNLIAVQSEVLMPVQPVLERTLKSKIALLMVVLAHAASIYYLAKQNLETIEPVKPAQPMQVSLIAPPTPEPEVVPIIEPPKPVVQPKPKLKKVVEKIQPLEVPAERMVEATTVEVKEATPDPVPPVQEVVEAKAPPKSEPVVVEEKIEPPKFGVAYLQNPEPEYPRMSKRLGEQGRVLLHVVVDTAGKPTEVTLKKSSGHERLDEAAIEAVKGWRFIPAMRNKVALIAAVDVPVKFSLQ
ncbi:energy transducer TonB [Methylotenera sp. 1P/1]|uniref:energy transducer TonB n=1 Tax=Methylotenera sp. 1P/1 TaxID=1131551 RepID=UPI000368F2ED|nr:energy transducer TonB [Methylotenera sp. 1P/1]